MTEQPPQLLQLRRRKLELLQRRATLQSAHGINFYKPHAKQNLFHRAGKFRYRYLRSGNRFGKSRMGGAEDVSWALGHRPFYPEGDPARYEGIPKYPCKILIICNDWDKSTEIFTNEGLGEKGILWKYIPPDAYKGKHKNHSGAIDMIALHTGGSIYIDTVKSYMQNPMGQESSVWDGIHVDEPCPKPMFIGAHRGLVDRNGKAWFTCTPLTEPWINDMFVSRRDQLAEKDIAIARGDKWFMAGSIYDNPYLSKEAIAAFEAELTEDEKQCRLYGRPLALAGTIYKQFDAARHIYYNMPHGWSDMANPPLDYTIRYAIDPHPKLPTAVLFAATSPFEEVYFFTEIWEKLFTVDVCEQIKAVTDKRFVIDAVCDPIAWIENPKDGTCMADDYMDCDVFVEKAVKDPGRGIPLVQSNLRRIDNWHFNAGLEETLYEFDHYMWDQKTNKPVDKDDHMMENLYRLAIGGLSYVKPPTPDEYRVISDISIDDADLELPDLRLD